MCNDTGIVFVGGGGHARSLAAALGSGPARVVEAGGDDDFLDSGDPRPFTVTMVAGPRRRVIDRYERECQPIAPPLVSPRAFVAADAVLGAGSQVLANAVVNTGSVTGRHCIVNTGAIVEHDCRLGFNVFVGPGAVLCGAVEVGDDVFIGANATILPGVKICAGAKIGAASMVARNIKVAGTYAGNPARCITTY